MTTTATIDETKLNTFIERVSGEFAAVASAPLVLIGDKLGLYKTLASAGALNATELAARTGTDERYIRPWLINQAAAGYVEYDPATDTYTLPAEHALVLADDNGPIVAPGLFQLALAITKAEPRIAEAFRTGGGLAWGEHDPGLFEGTDRLFRPGYAMNLVPSWLPALEGVVEKLERGATVADVGCGYGASTIIMARAYPNSRFFGFDNHPASIEAARATAEREGVSERTVFAVAGADDFPGSGYDLVAFFDCLHDMGRPIDAARHAASAIADGGTLMLVEPFAGDRVEDNINPIGRLYYAASTTLCCAHAISEKGMHVVGALAGPRQLGEILRSAGLGVVRRAAQTPFNLIIEARH